MLLIKLTLVPALLALVTLVARRWGPARGGALAGMPWVVAPILLVVLIERGAPFATEASAAAFLAVPASIAFLVVLAHGSYRMRLPWAVAVGFIAWLCVGYAAVTLLTSSAWSAVPIVMLLLAMPSLLPKPTQSTAMRVAPARDLPLRMLAGAILTLVTSAVATRLGGQWTGLVAAFPVITVVLGVMSWLSFGRGYMNQMLRGMATGYFSLATFSLSLSLLLPRWSPERAYLASCLLCAVVHWLALRASAMNKSRLAAASRPS